MFGSRFAGTGGRSPACRRTPERACPVTRGRHLGVVEQMRLRQREGGGATGRAASEQVAVGHGVGLSSQWVGFGHRAMQLARPRRGTPSKGRQAAEAALRWRARASSPCPQAQRGESGGSRAAAQGVSQIMYTGDGQTVCCGNDFCEKFLAKSTANLRLFTILIILLLKELEIDLYKEKGYNILLSPF